MRQHLSQVLVVLALALAPLPLVVQPASAATCTITGTSGDDRLTGTDRADVICGFGGNDRIFARGGNDVLLGGPGNDLLVGEGGADRLDGGLGNDSLLGRAGNDTLLGGDGADELVDEGGADTARGGDGNDVFGAGEGTDTYDGGAGRDTVKYLDRPAVKVSLDGVANDGVTGENDSLVAIEDLGGSSRRDVLVGNGAANRIDGGDGNDTIRGLGGADILLGGGGEDRLEGGDGDDRLLGGAYPDLILGGAGADSIDGQTAEYFRNVCEDDPADTVARCLRDGTAPTGTLNVVTDVPGEAAAGGTFGLDVNTEDQGGTARIEARVLPSGGDTDLGWCPSRLTPAMTEQTRSDNSWTATCSIPGDAAPQDVTVQVRLVDRLGNATAWGDPDRSRTVTVVVG